MKHTPYYLVLDVGTTGIKTFLFDEKLQQVAKSYRSYPIQERRKGWIEQDPNLILDMSIETIKEVVKISHVPKEHIRSIGIANQRETVVAWDKKNGNPIYPAIVWQDTRTKYACKQIEKKYGPSIRSKTGLTVDSYFSATKINWLIEHVKNAKILLKKKQLLVGTIDTWLLWNLCENHPHLTDETNASRTLLLNIKKRTWDPQLLDIFNVPKYVLPVIRPSYSSFGILRKSIIGLPIPVKAVCGDQQASFFAARQLSLTKPTTKATYGTGVFVMQGLGQHFELVEPFFTTLVPSLKGKAAYALEFKVGVSGPQVTKRLKKIEALKAYLYQLAKRTDVAIRKLPIMPKSIMVDGGSSRDGIILAIQEHISGTLTMPLPTYDGTALGIAILLSRKGK
jgi:glycerol kinase